MTARRKKLTEKRITNEIGRPPAKIDWNEVNELLTAGCSGVEIAGYLGLNKNTIYERCRLDNNMEFCDYSVKFYSKGDSLLRKKQFDKALGKVIDGDNTQLIWLGKNRLKQSESPQELAISQETLTHFKAIMNQLSGLQSNALTTADNNSSTECKSDCVGDENTADEGNDS